MLVIASGLMIIISSLGIYYIALMLSGRDYTTQIKKIMEEDDLRRVSRKLTKVRELVSRMEN